MKNNIGKIFIVVGVAIIVVSMLFLIVHKNGIEQKKEDAINLETQFKEAHSDAGAKHHEAEQSEPKVEQSESPAAQSKSTENIPQTAVGVIRIDKINLVMPILDNTGEAALLDGAGVLEDTDLPSSQENTLTVLAGHRGGRNENLTFLNIDKLAIGDEVKITTSEETLYYRVVGSEIIEPTDWSQFTREEDKTKLILMACHPYPTDEKRLLIESELVQAQAN